jgi:hypothetical protein
MVACVEGAFHYLEAPAITSACVSATEAAKTADAALIKITAVVADKKKGTYPCTLVTKADAVPLLYATWTGAGWAAASTDGDASTGNTTGAKAMAGALAAGALAVAATQF